MLHHDPFDYVVVRGFLRGPALAEACRDFPEITAPGLFPVETLPCAAGFARLIDSVGKPGLAQAFSGKFNVALKGCALMITVRGQCRADDGAVHTDSRNKLISALLYLNNGWDAAGGRLRLLRSDRIDDVAVEVPPEAGTLVAFRRTDQSFHGHLPFVGTRRYVMFNWLVSDLVAAREVARHRLSANIKRLMGRRS